MSILPSASCTSGFVTEARLREQFIYNTSVIVEEARGYGADHTSSELNIIQRPETSIVNGKGYLCKSIFKMLLVITMYI